MTNREFNPSDNTLGSNVWTIDENHCRTHGIFIDNKEQKEYKWTQRNIVVIAYCSKAVIVNSFRKWAGILIAFNKRQKQKKSFSGWKHLVWPMVVLVEDNSVMCN